MAVARTLITGFGLNEDEALEPRKAEFSPRKGVLEPPLRIRPASRTYLASIDDPASDEKFFR